MKMLVFWKRKMRKTLYKKNDRAKIVNEFKRKLKRIKIFKRLKKSSKEKYQNEHEYDNKLNISLLTLKI